MSRDEYKYQVNGYPSQDEFDKGSVREIAADTLKEAKEKAKRILTVAEARESESSRVLGYSQVIDRFSGEVVADFFPAFKMQDVVALILEADGAGIGTEYGNQLAELAVSVAKLLPYKTVTVGDNRRNQAGYVEVK